MIQNATLISVILPTYNRSKYISKSIESVLSQSYRNWELIIVDDASTDNTSEIIKSYQKNDNRIVIITNQKNLGVAKSLNKGLNIAKGDFIARIDDDDIWISKDKIKMQVEFLKNNYQYGIVGTWAIMVNEKGKEIGKITPEINDLAIRKELLAANQFVNSSVMFRKEVIDKVGVYNSESRVEDLDLWLRIGLCYKLKNLPYFLVRYLTRRISSIIEYNKSFRKRLKFKETIKTIKKYKSEYPNYWQALIKNYCQLYYFSLPLPKSISRKIIQSVKLFKN